MLSGKSHLINRGNNSTWGGTCWDHVSEVIPPNVESNCLAFYCIGQETNTTADYSGITEVHTSKKLAIRAKSHNLMQKELKRSTVRPTIAWKSKIIIITFSDWIANKQTKSLTKPIMELSLKNCCSCSNCFCYTLSVSIKGFITFLLIPVGEDR